MDAKMDAGCSTPRMGHSLCLEVRQRGGHGVLG